MALFSGAQIEIKVPSNKRPPYLKKHRRRRAGPLFILALLVALGAASYVAGAGENAFELAAVSID